MSERERFEEWADTQGWEVRRHPLSGAYTVSFIQRQWLAWQARARIAEQEKRELVRLLKRYRDETPLGHQPHMIAGEVDALLAKYKERTNES